MQDQFYFNKLFLCFFLFISSTALAVAPNSELVGTTQGSFSVTPSGSASYNIPIQLPPNIGGVQPSLSLSYDSSAGNGLLGMGWNLSGLSVVSRCPTTLDREGYIDGVDFDSNDQFCLDGQRLVHISGNEYRTEIDNFAKITGTTNGFTVVTPSGLTMRYGTTTNSRVYLKGQPSKLMTWALNKAEDAYGNHYTIQYENNSLSSGEYYATSYHMYGGQALLSHVELEYDDRNDVISGYQAGSEYQISKRLTALKTYSKNNLTKQYFLQYSDAVEPQKTSYVESIEECDSYGNCLEDLLFSFPNQVEEEFEQPIITISNGEAAGGKPYSTDGKYEAYLDLNGDGLTDRIWLPAGKLDLYASLSTGNDFAAPTVWLANGSLPGIKPYSYNGKFESYADVNGDGLPDRVWVPRDKYDLYVALSTGSGFATPEIWLTNGEAGGGYPYSGDGLYESYQDVNGDGLADRVWLPKGKHDLYVALSTGTDFAAPTVWLANGSLPGIKPYSYSGKFESYADVNGDGLADRVWVPRDKYDLYVALSTGSGFSTPEIWLTNGEAEGGKPYSTDGLYESYQDVNGDGLADRVWLPHGKFNLYVALSTGTDFATPSIWLANGSLPGIKPYSYNGKFESYADVNGDGLPDRVWVPREKYDLYVALSTGSEFATPKVWLENGAAGGGYPYSGDGKYESYADINGDGRADRVWVPKGKYDLYVAFAKSSDTKITSISNGLDTDISISYSPLTNSAVYQKDSLSVTKNLNANHPSPYNSIIQTTPSAYVVSQVTEPDGVGGTIATHYKYEGLRYDLYSKRSLGFAKTITENFKTGIRSESNYNQNYPHVGMVTSTLTGLMSSGQNLSISSHSGFGKRDTSGKKTYFPYSSEKTETTYLLNDDLLQVGSKTVSTHSDFNNSGQLTDRTISTSGTDGSGIFTVETNNTYTNGYANRRQGEITDVSVTSRAPNQASITRTSSFEYDWSKGHIVKEVIEPGRADPSITRVSMYGYDSFGNRISTVTCDGNYEYSCTTSSPGARFSNVQFSSDGLFAISETNSLGHSTSRNYDPRFGVVTSTTDINGLTTTSNYDSLGRKISSTNAFNQTATITREWCDASCPTVQGQEAYSKVTTQAPNAPTNIVYLDQYNREIRKEREGFGSEMILVDTEYDDFGRVKRTSEPYFGESGVTIYWNTPAYDVLGRKVSVSSPNQDGAYDTISSISYQGFSTAATDALGRMVVEVKNVMGQVVKMTDKASNDTLYEYDALGNLSKTTDSDGNEFLLAYDIRGRKIEMDDPDMGIWKYKYNTFDQLVEQSDAKNQVTKIAYDTLGRMTSRTDAFGTSNAKTSTWSFYTAPTKSKGKLFQKTASNGDYTRYTYNSSYGQLVTTDQKIGTKLFSVKNAYDSLGRLSTITYPGTTAYSSGLKLVREYNSKGFLSLVRKEDNSKTYWQANALSPRGQLEAATYGNGVHDLNAHSEANGWLIASQVYKDNTDLNDMTYVFDSVGNIKQRTDGLQNTMTEYFDYDQLDRLVGSYIYGGPSGVNHIAKSYAYDELGNIISKSDVGSYSYSGCGGRPHAVCNAGGTVYSYDANGNMLTGVKGSTTTQIGYTAFNKANYMQKGNYAVTFNYDADRNRNYKSRIQNGSLNLQTYYVGTSGKGAKIFEQEISSATGTKNIHYIYAAGGQAVAAHITEGTAKRTEYFHRDHLGSVALVTNDSGQAVSPVSFDAWGKRRNTNWSDNNTGSGLPEISGNIGFTGQETIKEIGLIHMNGRIYDPNLGKFLSADPMIQSPYNSQSYNRYSYVMNNPLSLVDPSGYSWLSKKWKSVKKFAKKNWSTVKFIATAYMFGPTAAILSNKSFRHYVRTHKWSQQAASFAAGVADAFGCAGACSAANSAYLTELNGGNFGDILKSAALAYASYAAFSAVNAHYGDTWNLSRVASTGLVGGTISKASGGKFSDGFRMAGGLASFRMAWEHTKSITNSYKQTACSQGLSSCKYNYAGELLTDGGRGEVQYPGTHSGNGNFITKGGMALEGSGQHLYSENSLLGRFVNHVSKTHDWFNSDLSKAFGFRGYDSVTGMWFAGSETYNTAFQLYSFSGMLPAAALTSLSIIQPLSGNIIQERNRSL